MDKLEQKPQEVMDIEHIAEGRAKTRAYDARWNLDIAIFAFAVLILVIILGFQKVGIEIVAPVAVVGLALVWLCGWRQGKKVYDQFYNEEMFALMRETRIEESSEKLIEDTLEEMVQKAIRDRFK